MTPGEEHNAEQEGNTADTSSSEGLGTRSAVAVGSATDDVAAIATVRVNQQPTTALPELKTGRWTYKGIVTPDPISIEKTRKLLAAGYGKIPCEVPGAGTHGYAWMVKKEQQWNKRKGTILLTLNVVLRHTLRPVTLDPKPMVRHKINQQAYHIYHHLKEEGKERLIKWFSEEMFVDMHEDGKLPTDKTPREMLDHLSEMYAKPHHYRKHMNQVKTDFACKYNPKKPVEVYFMRLQEARERADLLEQSFTEKQTINKALDQFEKQHGTNVAKAEHKWNEKDEPDQTWINFKKHLKDYINTWKSTGGVMHHGYHVDELREEVEGMKLDLSALQAENRTYQEENNDLQARQHDIHQALQTEQVSQASWYQDEAYSRRSSKISSDEISALTEMVGSLVKTLTNVPHMATQNTNAAKGSN